MNKPPAISSLYDWFSTISNTSLLVALAYESLDAISADQSRDPYTPVYSNGSVDEILELGSLTSEFPLNDSFHLAY